MHERQEFMQDQTPTPSDSALTPPNGHVPVSPRRAPLSPLAVVSTRTFMQRTGIQHDIDACKVPATAADFVWSMRSLVRTAF